MLERRQLSNPRRDEARMASTSVASANGQNTKFRLVAGFRETAEPTVA
jgi:hypothetical protein